MPITANPVLAYTNGNSEIISNSIRPVGGLTWANALSTDSESALLNQFNLDLVNGGFQNTANQIALFDITIITSWIPAGNFNYPLMVGVSSDITPERICADLLCGGTNMQLSPDSAQQNASVSGVIAVPPKQLFFPVIGVYDPISYSNCIIFIRQA